MSLMIFEKDNIKIYLRRMLLLLVMAAGVLTAPVRAQVNAEQVISIGRNVLGMDDYVLSIHYFNLAISAKPYLADPYYLRAVAKVMLEDYPGAEADASLALERNKFLTEAYRVRGFARQRLGRDSLALIDFEACLSHRPIDKSFLYYKGASQTALKHYEDARKTFATLLRYFPNFEAAYAERARLNLLMKDTAAALADIDTTISKDKSQAFPYLLRAEINFNRRNWSQARADMDRAIELEPKETDLYLNRAYVRYNDDDYFGAMSDYNYILELSPGNMAARYNRALLRYEVRDLSGASTDFAEVLKQEPDNFHARYAHALVSLELNQYQASIADFEAIARKYPKFYPVYYGMAQCYNALGNTSRAVANYNKAENLVRLYVTDPNRHPLDRPTINAAARNTSGYRQKPEESEMDVMNRFNELVTVSSTLAEPELTYNESIHGKVQDRDMKVEPLPPYALSIYQNASELRPSSNYFHELTELNNARYVPYTFYLTPGASVPSDRNEIDRLFSISESITAGINAGNPRAVDYFNRAVVLTLLKNYDQALTDLDSALALKPDMTVALMARAATRIFRASSSAASSGAGSTSADPAMSLRSPREDLRLAGADLDQAISLDPRLTYAWFNKGNIYYSLGDYTSALECYNKALEINRNFGEAYYNRGLTYLNLGNKESGRADLSRAGELGILPSYSLMKRMN